MGVPRGGQDGQCPPLDFMKVKITGVTISRVAEMPNSSYTYTSSNKLWDGGELTGDGAIMRGRYNNTDQ